MSGPVVTVTVDLRDAEAGLASMEHKARALGAVMRSLVKPLRDDQKNHKRERTGSTEPWAPLSAATLAHATKHRSAASMLGRLPSAVSYKATPLSITGISKVAWSEAHQDGDRVGHGARLPAREFLWISDDMQRLADEQITTTVVDAFGGKP